MCSPYYETFKKSVYEKSVLATTHDISYMVQPSFFILNSENIKGRQHQAKDIEDYIEKCKLEDLKKVIKEINSKHGKIQALKMGVSGSKLELKEKIKMFLDKEKKATVIQKNWRMHIVLKFMKLRGNKYDVLEFVNQTDFCTLEPLDKIPFELFFSFVDKYTYQYGFNIMSLLHYLKENGGSLINPYNRKKIAYIDFERLCEMCKLMGILFPDVVAKYKYLFSKLEAKRELKKKAILASICEKNPDKIETPVLLDTEDEVFYKLNKIRRKSVMCRIIGVFLEIDRLGHYSNYKWFANLGKNDYVKFYRNYYVWWNETANMDEKTKSSVCVVVNPFVYIEYLDCYTQITKDEMQGICLHLIENMVYGGVSREYRKLGAMHVLHILAMGGVKMSEKVGDSLIRTSGFGVNGEEEQPSNMQTLTT